MKQLSKLFIFNQSLLKKCIEFDTRLLEGHYFLGIGFLGTQMY